MIGKKITELRNKKGLTQLQAAKKLKMPRSTYSNYELDKREPDFHTAQKLSEFYEITVDELLGTDSKKPILSDLELSDNELIKKYNVVLDGKPISEDVLREILSYVRVRRSLK